MKKSGRSDAIIEDIVGCGKFQVIMSLCVYFLANSSPAFTVMFMSFGNFDPGWKCLHQNSSQLYKDKFNASDFSPSDTNLNHSNTMINIIYSNTNEIHHKASTSTDGCINFESCEHVEFDPESSTIVSEWGLVCSRKWIPSFIISLQMFGLLVGSLFSGYLADAIGRRVTIYSAHFIVTCFNFVSVFSSSWQAFAVLRFFLGVSSAFVMSLHYAYTAEFVPNKWRSLLQGIPAWSTSTILFALTCMYYKDWRHIHIVTVIVGIVGLIPAVWIPESLRWLEVKNRTQEFEKTAEKIARINGKKLSSLEHLGHLVRTDIELSTKSSERFNFCHLFNRGIRKYTLFLTMPWIVVALVNYALGFGVKSLHGNFYINLIISSFIDIPFAILPIVLPNVLGRKPSAVLFSMVTGICLIGASGLDFLTSHSFKDVGIVVLIFIGKVTISGTWCVLALMTLEIYPTVVRCLGTSWSLTLSKIGAIAAPLFIPDGADTVFVSYLTMGVLSIICCLFIIKLPETKGRPLQETL